MSSSVLEKSKQLLSDERLGKARSYFPHTKLGNVYLNHASSAPMSTPVIDAIDAHLRERSIGSIDTYLEFDVAKIEDTRNKIQALTGADSAERIAILTNTSDPINILASGLSWNAGDRIILHEAEFPANVWPYLNLKRHGVELDIIPQSKGHPSPELIADMMTPRTKLLALSAVQFLTGYRADLEAIGSLCRSNDVIFAVDGIQAVGAIRIDVHRMKIDAFAAGCQKWQLGPQGTSWLYLTEELQARIHPAFVGWLGVADPWNFFDYNQPLAAGARRFEGGTKNIPGIWGMNAALGLLLEFGPDAIEDHILSLTQMLITGMQTIDGIRIVTPAARNERAGIVTIELPPTFDGKNVFEALASRDIHISLRNGKLRYSPHFYNSPEEIEFAVSATRHALTI